MRCAWRALVADGLVDAKRFVFLRTSTARTPPCGRFTPSLGRSSGRRASRATGEEPHPTLQHDPFGHGSVAVEGATTRAVLEAHVEEALCLSLSPGQVVAMD